MGRGYKSIWPDFIGRKNKNHGYFHFHSSEKHIVDSQVDGRWSVREIGATSRAFTNRLSRFSDAKLPSPLCSCQNERICLNRSQTVFKKSQFTLLAVDSHLPCLLPTRPSNRPSRSARREIRVTDVG